MSSFYPSRESRPLFDGTKYANWKRRMEDYLVCIDFDLWTIVSEGPIIPIYHATRVPKLSKHFDDNDKRSMTMNARAKLILTESLTKEEYNRVGTCQSAKEMWDALEVIYGHERVIRAQLAQLHSQYVTFRMRPTENILQMHARYMQIITSMFELGEVIPEDQQATNLIWSLREEYNPQVAVLEHQKGLTVGDAIGKLLAFEMRLLYQQQQRMETEDEGESAINMF